MEKNKKKKLEITAMQSHKEVRTGHSLDATKQSTGFLWFTLGKDSFYS